MQLHSSYVVTDPKGSIAVECGKLMLRNGYKVKIFNSINFKKSHHYNPFAYIHSEKDILKLVTTLIANTKGDGKSGDDFWQKAETLLYTALIGYIHYEAPEEEQNFATLIEFINAMEVREDDETFENNVDLAFKELASREPNHFAVRQYKKYKLAAGKTAKSINISCGARLAPFDIQELREITMYDELELDTLGDRKTALFLIMSDTDSTFNFLISMIYSQLFNLLCEKADDGYSCDKMVEDIKTVLRSQNEISPTDEHAISSFTIAKQFETFDMLFTGINILVWLVGIGTLLAGIIGVSNIMMVTVRERTREIGVRRAIGAKPFDIISQIMSESLLLTSLAGLIGLSVGVFLLDVVNNAMASDGDVSNDTFFSNPEIHIGTAVAATVILLFSGLLAGLIPAWRAMQIKAIDAIREE